MATFRGFRLNLSGDIAMLPRTLQPSPAELSFRLLTSPVTSMSLNPLDPSLPSFYPPRSTGADRSVHKNILFLPTFMALSCPSLLHTSKILSDPLNCLILLCSACRHWSCSGPVPHLFFLHGLMWVSSSMPMAPRCCGSQVHVFSVAHSSESWAHIFLPTWHLHLDVSMAPLICSKWNTQFPFRSFWSPASHLGSKHRLPCCHGWNLGNPS